MGFTYGRYVGTQNYNMNHPRVALALVFGVELANGRILKMTEIIVPENITWIDARNPKYINSANTKIELEVNFEHIPEQWVTYDSSFW